MVAAIGNGAAFSKGRDFGAWLGLVPRQMSTGDRTILGKISKRGNRYLRVLFVQAAWVVLVRPKIWERHGLKSWIEAAKKRLHHKYWRSRWPTSSRGSPGPFSTRSATSNAPRQTRWSPDPHDRIKLIHGDTTQTPYSTGTWGSRCAIMSGGAVAAACEQLADRLKRIGATLLQSRSDDVRLERGMVVAAHGRISVAEIARTWYRRPQDLPGVTSRPLGSTSAGYKAKRDTGTFSYAAHAAAVAVAMRGLAYLCR
jgi:Molybdopterin-binding domain of aldehyde dehydrogenase/Transposase IS116/IS110/IS902 family